MKTSLKILTLAAAAVALTACNVSQDGSGKDTRVGMNGMAVDGRVANALVWVDRNDNFELDRDIEPYARTDSQGYFSYRPAQNGAAAIDYCADESADVFRHCLRYGSSDDAAVLRIKGGIDIATGERLKGVMALDTAISAASQQSNSPLVTSPITSLLSEADATQRIAIETALGLPGGFERKDFSEPASAEEYAMLANAMSIQAMQDMLGALADDGPDTKSRMARNSAACDKKNTRAQRVLCAISEQIAEGDEQPIDMSDDKITQLITKVKVPSGATRDRLLDALRETHRVTKRIRDLDPKETTQKKRKAAVRTSQVAFVLARRGSVDDHAGSRTRLEDLDDAELDNLDKALEGEDENADFDLLSLGNDLADNPGKSVEDAAAAAKLGLIGEPNQWLVLQVDPDDADADEAEPGSYVAFYFGGTDDGGDVAACAYARPVDSKDGDEEVLKHEYISGKWGKLSSGRITLDLKYTRFEREGQLIARATAGKYRLTTIDDDGDTQEAFSDSHAEATEKLNEDGGFARPSSTVNNCEALHNQISAEDHIGWTS